MNLRPCVLVAVPQENSDISANSQDFRGGNIRINTQGIFGTQFREQPTPLSDITATGVSSELSGMVEINTPDVDPRSGLVELPAEVVDPTGLIAQACPVHRDNSFTVTGRGGLPPLPSEPLRTNNTVPLNWVTLDRHQSSAVVGAGLTETSTFPPINPINPPVQLSVATDNRQETTTKIVEATGWVINNEGKVVLIASAPTVTAHSSWSRLASCPTP